MRPALTSLPSLSALSALVFAAGGAAAQPPAPAPRACSPDGNLEYVCGAQNAEDILQLGDSRWLLLSGMSGMGPGEDIDGHLYLVDRETRGLTEWFPGDSPRFAHNREAFGGCPGQLDVDNFSAHGLALRENGANAYRLYITSHDAREAIEVFDVSTAGEMPRITWIGCVVLPSSMFSNSVAILEDGGFVTTKMMDREDPAGFQSVASGNVTGGVYERHPGGELELVPGTELSGANGIALSDDERYMYVAAMGGASLVRFDRRATPVAKETVALPVRPDNVRWGDDGWLYTVGNDVAAAAGGGAGWSVVAIDPRTMAAERVTGAPAGVALSGASSALPVDDEIWIGTFRGDRVGILPRP
jgi:hypothetical protein